MKQSSDIITEKEIIGLVICNLVKPEFFKIVISLLLIMRLKISKTAAKSEIGVINKSNQGNIKTNR